jgi:putative nucleotidyltransferase with HDIG domain
MVANLSEAACEAVGANGLLARVGAYYHDIGKTKRPQYFIENQMNIDNPHDKLSPQLSKNIIIAHATDGADMLRDHKMPKELVDIAEQHHGTSLLKFFTIRRKKKAIRRLKKSSAILALSPRQKRRRSSRWPTVSKLPSAQCITRIPKGLKSWCAGSYQISCRTAV